MQAKGLRTELMIIPGVDYSFIGATATRDASRAALARTIDFIDSVIGGKPAGCPPRAAPSKSASLPAEAQLPAAMSPERAQE